MNIVKIHGIKLTATIGVYDWERKQPQPLVINLDLTIPHTAEAFQEDKLEGTIDYAAVVEDLKSWLANHECKLLEFLAEQMSQRFFNNYPLIQSLKIEIFKPNILAEAAMAAIYIERNRPAHA